MIYDGAMQFSGTAGIGPDRAAGWDSPTTGTQQSSNILDILTPRDLGIGDDPSLDLFVRVMATFTGGTSLMIQFQGSVDNSTWTTYAESGAILEANLIAGRNLLDIPLPRPAPVTPAMGATATGFPRYYRLQYVSVGTHTAGSLYAAVVLDREDRLIFPSGITVPN